MLPRIQTGVARVDSRPTRKNKFPLSIGPYRSRGSISRQESRGGSPGKSLVEASHGDSPLRSRRTSPFRAALSHPSMQFKRHRRGVARTAPGFGGFSDRAVHRHLNCQRPWSIPTCDKTRPPRLRAAPRGREQERTADGGHELQTPQARRDVAAVGQRRWGVDPSRVYAALDHPYIQQVSLC